MNKRSLKLAGMALGLTLAVGAIGTAIGTAGRGAIEAKAVEYAPLYSADFTSLSTYSYALNATKTLSSKDWLISASQYNSSVFYLGVNSGNASKGCLGKETSGSPNENGDWDDVVAVLKSNDTVFNANPTTVHAYAMLFDYSYSDVTKVSFNWAGGNNAFQVYLFGDSGSGFTKLGNTNYSSSGAAVSGSVEWTGSATNYSRFAVVARPGATNSSATSKTLRATTFTVYKTKASAPSYAVSASFNDHASIDVSSVNENAALSATITAADHYTLPDSVTVTVNGSAYNGFTYTPANNKLTASFSIPANVINGAVVVSGTCTPDPQYTITYEAGEHATDTEATYDDLSYAGDYTLLNYSEDCEFEAASGYEFVNWKIGDDYYNAGDSIDVSGDVTATAQWAEIVSLTYDKNGGTGTNSSSSIGKGSSVTVGSNSFTKTGYEFTKWNTKADGSGTSYEPGDSITVNADTTLYAQWGPVLDITLTNWNDDSGTNITTSYETTYTSAYSIATHNSTTTLNMEAYGVYNNSSGIQMNKGKGTYIKNTNALPTGAYITKIICTWTATGKNSPTIYVAKDAVASTSSTKLGTGSNAVTTQTFEVSNASSSKYNYFYFDGTTVTGACYLTHLKVCYGFNNELSSIAVNATQDQLTFTVGDTFTFAGSVTPTKLLTGAGSETTDNLEFKIGSGSYFESGDYTLTAADNGKSLNVKYTEGGKSVNADASYNLIVNYAAVTSVSISTSTSEIGKSDNFTFAATVAPTNANPDVTWDATSTELTKGTDFSIDSNGKLTTTASAGGSITVTATTKGKNSSNQSISDSVTVEVTGDPVVTVNASLSGYSTQNASLSYSFSNFTDTLSVVSGDPTKVTVGTPTTTSGTTGSGTVQVNFLAATAQNTPVVLSFKNGDDVIATCNVTVIQSAVYSVVWTASSDLQMYSDDAKLVAEDITDLAPKYSMNYATTTFTAVPVADYSIKIDGSAYSLGDSISVGEHTISLVYGGIETSASNPTLTVVQTLNDIQKENVSTLTFTAQCSGSGTSDDGASWTVTSDGTESTFDPAKGIHYGTSSAAVQYIKLSTSDIDVGTITKIVVNASTASKVTASVSVTVDGSAFGGDPQSLTTSAADYTFEGSAAADDIEVTITKPSSANNAIYCLSVAVTYEANMANDSGNEFLQQSVIDFAEDFLEETGKICKDSSAGNGDTDASALATKWSALASDYDDAITAAGDDADLFKNYFKYADYAGVDEEDKDVLQKMLDRYDVICGRYTSLTDFLNTKAGRDEVPAASGAYFGNGILLNSASSAGTVIAVFSACGLAAIGGYFFLRKREER